MTPLQTLQKKLGLNPDNQFGPATLNAAARYFKLSPLRAAHFFGQTGHETGNFTRFTENLNYSAQGLRTVFPKYFPTEELAQRYARNPQAIANRVYANRMGNRNEASGDGWLFRGRGALQLTGRVNYQLFASTVRNPAIMTLPELVETEYSFHSAIWFFNLNSLWAICDKGTDDATITQLTRRINGGTNGLKHRIVLTRQYQNWLK